MLRFIGRAHNAVAKLFGLIGITVILLWAMCRYPGAERISPALVPKSPVAASEATSPTFAKKTFIPLVIRH